MNTQSLSMTQKAPSSYSGKVEKAKLMPVDGGEKIEFQFNPELLSFERSIEVNSSAEGRDSNSKGLRKISFAGPNPVKLSISNITFDTFEQDNVSVLTYIDKLNKALDCTVADSQINGQKRPPIYVFVWGTNKYLRCFVESLSYKITMFMPDGRPVRAVANLVLKQVEEGGIGEATKPAQQPAKK